LTREFKLQVVREVEAGKSPAQAARAYQVHPTVIVRWGKAHRQYAERAFTGHGRLLKDEARLAELARLLGQLTMENALFKKALLRLEAQCRERAGTGGSSCSSWWPQRSRRLRRYRRHGSARRWS
jgi:transposase